MRRTRLSSPASFIAAAFMLTSCQGSVVPNGQDDGGAASSSGSAYSSPASVEPSSGSSVVYYADASRGKRTSGYLALPDGEGPFPALVLIHEWWGLNDQIRRMADRFAAAGYAALAVDLYDGALATTQDEARANAGRVRDNVDEAFNNLAAALEYLRAHPAVDREKLASVGWCFGGQWAYEVAKNNLGVRATVMYYGRFNLEDDLSHMVAHIQGHFGEDDEGIPVDDVRAFRAKLEDQGGRHEIFIYPNAGHAFMNEEGETYDANAADEAWDRTIRFLREAM